MPDTIRRLRRIIAEHLGIPECDQPADLGAASLTGDLGADSLDILELSMAVEEAFEIEITDAEAERALGPDGDMPLAGLVELIERKCA